MALLDVDEVDPVAWIESHMDSFVVCEHCGCMDATVHRVTCQTAYVEKEKNVSPLYCSSCAEDYYDYWNNLWREYYGGIRGA